MQDLPFPAVTFNAAKLRHPYRLIEAVHNDVKIDCRSFYPSSDSECEQCFNDTVNFRNDLAAPIKTMVKEQYEFYLQACQTDFEGSENTKKTMQGKSEYLKYQCYSRGYHAAVSAVHACLNQVVQVVISTQLDHLANHK